MQRKRKLTLSSFMMMIFSQPGTLSLHSLTGMCGKLGNQGVYLSKQALNQRINEGTVSFLREVYLHLYKQQLELRLTAIPLRTTIQFNRVRILDGSTVTLSPDCGVVYPGSVGAGVKFQIEYDLLTGRFIYIELQEGKAGDGPSGTKRLHTIEKGDLFLQDLGYFSFNTFNH